MVCGSLKCSPSGSRQSPAAKRYLVHFGLKNDSGKRNFKGTFTKNMFVFSLFQMLSVEHLCSILPDFN